MTTTQHSSTNSGWQFRNQIFRLAAQLQAHWQHHRTEKMLEALPAEIRKDIGWPSSDETDAAARSRH